MKTWTKVVLSAFGLLAFGWALGWYTLGWNAYFTPKRENIRRNVWENTQSYTHGKLQDLAKYYREYQDEDDSGRAAIKAVICAQFAEFDETKVDNDRLRLFLIQQRGY